MHAVPVLNAFSIAVLLCQQPNSPSSESRSSISLPHLLQTQAIPSQAYTYYKGCALSEPGVIVCHWFSAELRPTDSTNVQLEPLNTLNT